MLYVNEYKKELLNYVNEKKELFIKFDGLKLVITGAAGLIGSYIADLFLTANEELNILVKVYLIDKNIELLGKRFADKSEGITCICCDVNCEDLNIPEVDYIIHAASNTSPVDYAMNPVSTIHTNVIATDRLIRFSLDKNVKRFLFCSSVEAYGQNNGDVDEFDENYSGYVNSNTLRAAYPAAKRVAEALCNAYAKEYESFDFAIARIGRIYGPTVIPGDTKAPSQFITNAVEGKDIVLKSDGMQEYSFGYVGDCAIALIMLLISGKSGEAYNIADPNSRVLLREFANFAAEAGKTKVVYSAPSQLEAAGYSKITKAVLSTKKLSSIGWTARYDAREGIKRTVDILKKMQ